jgi:hypothetical protein
VVWLFVHIAFLNGFANRVMTLLRWARAMIGRARPERVFSVGHTGGDLSLPEEIKAQVMPSPFPVMDVLRASGQGDRDSNLGRLSGDVSTGG